MILQLFDLTERDLHSSDVFMMQHCNQMMKLISVAMATRNKNAVYLTLLKNKKNLYLCPTAKLSQNLNNFF